MASPALQKLQKEKSMAVELIPVGYNNFLAANRIVAIVSHDTAPIKRLVQAAKEKGLLIDMTNGHRTKAVMIMDSGHIGLAAVLSETIASRLSTHRRGSVS